MMKRILSFFLAAVMVLILIPIQAQAATHDLTIQKGETYATEGEDYEWNDRYTNMLVIKKDGLTVSGTTEKEYIYVDSSVTNLTIKDLSIALSNSYGIEFRDESVTVTLTVVGNNTIEVAGDYNGIAFDGSGKIDGNGNLSVFANSSGVYSPKNITLDCSGTITIDSKNGSGLSCYNLITVTENTGKVLIYGGVDEGAVRVLSFSDDGCLTIDPSLVMNASANYKVAEKEITGVAEFDSNYGFVKTGGNYAKSLLIAPKYGIIFSDGSTVRSTKTKNQTEFSEYIVKTFFSAGDTFQLYDFSNKESWTETIDEASTSNIEINGDNVYKASADGTYTLYYKIYGAGNTQIYVDYESHTHDFTGNYIEYDTTNHKWAKKCSCGEYDEDHTLIGVEIPKAKTGISYDGTKKMCFAKDYSDYCTIGNDQAVDAGVYLAKCILKEGYIWADGTTKEKDIEWQIAPKQLVEATADDAPYTGSKITPTIRSNGKALALSSEYTVKDWSGDLIEPGTYTGTVTFTGNYYGSATVSFTILSGPNVEHIVKFDLNNGETNGPEKQFVESGKKASAPETPTYEGFKFAGWYTDKDCTDGNEFDFESEIKKDYVLYAKWVASSKFNIILPHDDHGTAVAKAGGVKVIEAEPGTEISLEATPSAGYKFKEWHVLAPLGLEIKNNTFTMPNDGVMIEVLFEADEPDKYIILVNTDGNGKAAANKSEALEKEEVTLFAAPIDGYLFDYWETSPKVEITDNKFRMPESSVLVMAHFKEDAPKPVEVYYAPLVADLKANEEGVIEWKAGDSLPLEVVKLLVDKPELSLEFTFTYEGAEHTIFIPAGAFEQYYDVNIPWYGPAWLIQYFEKPQKDVIEYIIVKDDTLNALAEKFKCTVEELLALNPYITNPNRIYPNSKLLIPVQK